MPGCWLQAPAPAAVASGSRPQRQQRSAVQPRQDRTPDAMSDGEVARMLIMTQPHLMAEPNFASAGDEAVPASPTEATLLNEGMWHIERGLQSPQVS